MKNEPMTVDELVGRYVRGERTFMGSFFDCADPSGVKLQNTNLKRVNLAFSYLIRANLQGVNLQGANLKGANMEDSDLRGANLRDASLQGANLQGANLSSANLQGANLRDTQLHRANLDWYSHELLGEILRQAAGKDVDRRALAGLVSQSNDWCWEYWKKTARQPQWQEQASWAARVLLEWKPPEGIQLILESMR